MFIRVSGVFPEPLALTVDFYRKCPYKVAGFISSFRNLNMWPGTELWGNL